MVGNGLIWAMGCLCPSLRAMMSEERFETI